MLKLFVALTASMILIFSCGEDDTNQVLSSSDLQNATMQEDDSRYRPMNDLIEILNLDQEQQTQIREALIKDHQELRQNRTRARGHRRFFRSPEHRQRLYAIVEPLLNEQQSAIFAEMKAEIEAGKIPQRLLDKKLDRMSELLSLNAQQRSDIGKIISDTVQKRPGREQMQELERGERRKLMRQHRDQIMEELAAVLTPEQLQKLEEHRKTRRRH